MMETFDFAKASAYVDSSSKTIEIWDLIGTDFRDMEKEIHEQVEQTLNLDPCASFLEVAREALSDRLDGREEAGIEIIDDDGTFFEPYNADEDLLWESIRPLVNKTRDLKISTWGTRYILETPKGIERVYDASNLRGKRSKATIKLRGTDPILQKTVRDCDGFVPLLKRIVTDVERNNLYSIGIICRGGHHRSVSLAELLVNLYPNRQVYHLTIDT